MAIKQKKYLILDSYDQVVGMTEAYPPLVPELPAPGLKLLEVAEIITAPDGSVNGKKQVPMVF